MKYFPSLLFIILPFLFSCNGNGSGNYKSSKSQKTGSGKVIAIIDGDTYDILLEGNKIIRIRMEGIDAPEKGMPYYKVAKNYLGELCFDKYIRLEITGKDRHDRMIAFSYLDDGRELSHEMIKAGLAWHFKKYSSDRDLANLEINAKQAKLGLWADQKPMPPWENRRMHRDGISTRDSFDLEKVK